MRSSDVSPNQDEMEGVWCFTKVERREVGYLKIGVNGQKWMPCVLGMARYLMMNVGRKGMI